MVLRWAGHRHAPWYLGGLSFAESSFFPIPPDVMLAPMVMARPSHAWRLAALTTATSVLGGLLGYLIGYFALDIIEPWLHSLGWWEAYLQVRGWFLHWGFWVILVAGFSPIPYKLFTIAAGTLGLGVLPFVLGSLLGRGARFYLVAGLIAWGGPRLEPWLRTYIERIGWLTVALLAAGVLLLR
ncbi:DedA family protein [Alkalilimnicola sp. S0819]|nr:DedA family protein [Alkalilimnicola sp. S0819]MPQ15586.1 DedA family protein [Alkalilimnicola sp. S0819]